MAISTFWLVVLWFIKIDYDLLTSINGTSWFLIAVFLGMYIGIQASIFSMAIFNLELLVCRLCRTLKGAVKFKFSVWSGFDKLVPTLHQFMIDMFEFHKRCSLLANFNWPILHVLILYNHFNIFVLNGFNLIIWESTYGIVKFIKICNTIDKNFQEHMHFLSFASIIYVTILFLQWSCRSIHSSLFSGFLTIRPVSHAY